MLADTALAVLLDQKAMQLSLGLGFLLPGELLAADVLLKLDGVALDGGEVAEQFDLDVLETDSIGCDVAAIASDQFVRLSDDERVEKADAANAIGQVGSLKIASETLQRSAGRVPPMTPLDIRVRAWYNPDLVSAIFIIPGLLGAIVMQTTSTIIAMVVVRERERGTLEALIVSPLRRWELMLGKIVPNVLMAYAQMTFALAFGVWLFDIPVRGSLPLLYFLSLFFIMGTLGLGILLSTIAKTQQQAMQMSYFIFIPSIYLSGVLFPLEGMPPLAKAVAYVIPLTYYLQILRGIILKGIGISYLWTQLLVLTAIGTVLISASILRFRKKLG